MKRALPLLLCLGAGPLLGAAEPEKSPYETSWMVTQEADADWFKPRAIEKNTIVFEQKIQFEHLAESDIAVTEAANGEVFVPAGEQFYKAVTAGPELWCTANMKMPEGAVATDIIGRVYSQYCILDADKDGVFDGFFKRARTIESLPTVKGKIRDDPRPIKPLRLTEVAPEKLRTNYFRGIVFFGNAGKADQAVPRFQEYAGSEHGRFLIEKTIKGTNGEHQVFSLNGASIEYSTREKGIEIQSVKIFPSGPLTIVGTNCGMINGC